MRSVYRVVAPCAGRVSYPRRAEAWWLARREASNVMPRVSRCPALDVVWLVTSRPPGRSRDRVRRHNFPGGGSEGRMGIQRGYRDGRS